MALKQTEGKKKGLTLFKPGGICYEIIQEIFINKRVKSSQFLLSEHLPEKNEEKRLVLLLETTQNVEVYPMIYAALENRKTTCILKILLKLDFDEQMQVILVDLAESEVDTSFQKIKEDLRYLLYYHPEQQQQNYILQYTLFQSIYEGILSYNNLLILLLILDEDDLNSTSYDLLETFDISRCTQKKEPFPKSFFPFYSTPTKTSRDK